MSEPLTREEIDAIDELASRHYQLSPDGSCGNRLIHASKDIRAVIALLRQREEKVKALMSKPLTKYWLNRDTSHLWEMNRGPLTPIDKTETVYLTADVGQEIAVRERAVWEKITKAFDKKFMASDKRLDSTRDYRVDDFYKWLKQQAKGVKL